MSLILSITHPNKPQQDWGYFCHVWGHGVLTVIKLKKKFPKNGITSLDVNITMFSDSFISCSNVIASTMQHTQWTKIPCTDSHIPLVFSVLVVPSRTDLGVKPRFSVWFSLPHVVTASSSFLCLEVEQTNVSMSVWLKYSSEISQSLQNIKHYLLFIFKKPCCLIYVLQLCTAD